VTQSHRGIVQPFLALLASLINEKWQCQQTMHGFLEESLTIVLLADTSHSCHVRLAMGDSIERPLMLLEAESVCVDEGTSTPEPDCSSQHHSHVPFLSIFN
jgi:hypothetical protein